APALHSFQQVREDLALHTKGLSTEQVWACPHGLAPLGFQLKHIAGSVDRLTTCLEGKPLSEAQLEVKAREMDLGTTLEELLAGVDQSLRRSEGVIRALDPQKLRDPRTVGRLRLPTTVQGLVVHIAEHTQRHLGQAISATRLLKALSNPS